MNWEAIGSIGEIVGAVGVIVTLVFLTLQIRASTKESRLTATSEIAREYNTYLQSITANEALSELWFHAVDSGVDSLSGEERARVVMVMGNFFRLMESAYLQYESGRMDEASWQGYNRLIRRSLGAKMFPFYWRIRATMHNDEFQRFIEEAKEDADHRPMFADHDADEENHSD